MFGLLLSGKGSDGLDITVGLDGDTAQFALLQQHGEDIFCGVETEKLAVVALLVANAVAQYQIEKVPLSVAFQGCLAEMGIGRDKVVRLHHKIGEVALAAAGHEDFLAYLIGLFQYQHTSTSLAGSEGTEQAGGAGAENDGIKGEVGWLHWGGTAG